MRIKKKQTGASLFVLVATMALVSVVLLMTLSNTTTIARGSLLKNKTKSIELGERAVLKALNRLQQDTEFGQQQTEKVKVDLDEGRGVAYVSFSADEPFETRSINNMGLSSVSVEAPRFGTIPPRTVLLVGVGRYGQAKEPIYYLLQKKGLEHAVASSGAFRMSGENRVASLKGSLGQLAEFEEGDFFYKDKALEKTDKTSIATSFVSSDPSEPAMLLEGQLVLEGDALSASTGQATDEVVFERGSLKTGQADMQLQHVTPQEYHPKRPDSPITQSQITPLGSGTRVTDEEFDSVYVVEGDLYLDGSTQLSNSYIYVEGNVYVNGSVKGAGSIVAEGDISIHGHSEVSSVDKLALTAGGDITLAGQGSAQSLFKGSIFANGTVKVRNIAVVGEIVANNPDDPEKASFQGQDVVLIANDDAATVEITKEFNAPEFRIEPSVRLRLEKSGLNLVPPKTSDFVENNQYNGNPVRIGVEYQGKFYPSINEALAGIDDVATKDVLNEATISVSHAWQTALENHDWSTYSEEVLFSRKPNTVLSDTGDFKVLTFSAAESHFDAFR